MIYYKIEINTKTDISVPSINMTNGIIEWTPNGYDSISVIDGLFTNNWVSVISNGANIEEGGALAYTGKFSIFLTAISGVYDTLNALDVASGNIPIEIYAKDRSTERRVYQGVIAGLSEGGTTISVDVEDISRNRESESSYPYYIGESQLIELEKEEEISEVIAPLKDKAPIFYGRTFTADWQQILLTPYLVDTNETEILSWWAELVSQAQSTQKAIFVNGVQVQNYPYDAFDLGNGFYGILVRLLIGNTRDGTGISGAVEVNNKFPDAEPVEITLRKTVYKADNFGDSGGFTDEVLRDENGEPYGAVYSDLIVWGGDEVTSYDYDGKGYRLGAKPVAIYSLSDDQIDLVQTKLNLDNLNKVGQDTGWLTNPFFSGPIEINTSTLSNIIDGDYSTYGTSEYNVYLNLSQGGWSNELAYCFGVDFAPVETDGRVFATISVDVGEINHTGTPSWQCFNRSGVVGVAQRSTTIGSYKLTDTVGLGDDFLSGSISDMMPNSTLTPISYLDNYFPLIENAPASQKPFRYEANGFALKQDLSGFTIELTSLFDAVDLKAGVSLYFSVNVNLEGDNQGKKIGLLRFNINDVSMVEEVDIVSDSIYVNWNGRENNGTTVSQISDAYQLSCKLQNLQDTNINKPIGGWGLEVPSVADWNAYLNLSSSYGGINSIINREVVATVEDATKLKKDLAVSMVSLGAIDDNGIESLYSLVDGLNNTDGVLIKYEDLFENTEPIRKRIDQSEIYNEFDYNSVVSTNVDASNPSEIDDDELWAMGNVLFTAYGVKRRWKKDILLSDSVGNQRQFARDLMQWFGCVEEIVGSGVWIVKERYTLVLSLSLNFVFNNPLFVGQKIRYDDVFDDICSGIVYKREYDLINGKVKVYCHCLGTKTMGGGDRDVYIETGSAGSIINETGSQTDIIVEGE